MKYRVWLEKKMTFEFIVELADDELPEQYGNLWEAVVNMPESEADKVDWEYDVHAWEEISHDE